MVYLGAPADPDKDENIKKELNGDFVRDARETPALYANQLTE